jgi:hypothetical protein
MSDTPIDKDAIGKTASGRWAHLARSFERAWLRFVPAAPTHHSGIPIDAAVKLLRLIPVCCASVLINPR